MKKRWGVAAVLLAGALVGGALLYGCREREPEKKNAIRLGLLLYRGDDTFIGTLRESIEARAKEYERETGIKVTLDVMDAKSSQNTQNSQMERLLSLGCDGLLVNIVDRSAASLLIDKAMDDGVPLVFFNREPVEEDLNRWEHLYYVGVDAKESAVLQGQLLVDAYRADPSVLDLNGDGVVSYVLLEGETSHQDSLIRTEWSIETLKSGGVPLEKLTGGIANWERSQASALMEQWLAQYREEIELVISNNDDMALGAADALERAGIPAGRVRLVGIDGTPAGLEAIRDGELFGTVESDKEAYGRAVFDIAAGLALGAEPGDLPELTDSRYVWSGQRIVTRENIDETE